ncbi:MAG: pyruvate kinase alpha/beta domain-containing protein [Candidatus Sulfobium sp.]
MAIPRRTIYFEKPGRDNTSACLDVALEALKDGGYRHIVVASTSGSTGLLFSGSLRDSGVNLVVVTHSAGFKGPNTFEIPGETLSKMKENGARIYTGTILTHSIETSLSSKFSGVYPAMIIAQSLRRFGEGAKVCCEIVMMGADAGLIPEGEEVVAVAGTAFGADTVMVLKSAASKRFLELRVLEILAKPRLS